MGYYTNILAKMPITKVQMRLDPDVYQQALDAHRSASCVRVTGTLVRQGRSIELRNPGGFAIEEG